VSLTQTRFRLTGRLPDGYCARAQSCVFTPRLFFDNRTDSSLRFQSKYAHKLLARTRATIYFREQHFFKHSESKNNTRTSTQNTTTVVDTELVHSCFFTKLNNIRISQGDAQTASFPTSIFKEVCSIFFWKLSVPLCLEWSKIYRTNECKLAKGVLRRSRKSRTPVFFVALFFWRKVRKYSDHENMRARFPFFFCLNALRTQSHHWLADPTKYIATHPFWVIFRINGTSEKWDPWNTRGGGER
jgi:hypothetical protein